MCSQPIKFLVHFAHYSVRYEAKRPEQKVAIGSSPGTSLSFQAKNGFSATTQISLPCDITHSPAPLAHFTADTAIDTMGEEKKEKKESKESMEKERRPRGAKDIQKSTQIAPKFKKTAQIKEMSPKGFSRRPEGWKGRRSVPTRPPKESKRVPKKSDTS